MATEKEQKKLLDAFTQISEVWGTARNGLIVAANGSRAGTWSWNKSALLVRPQDDQFRTLIRRLTKDGVLIRQVTKRELDNPQDADFPADNTVLVSRPLVRLTPGELDHVLKVQGYFVIDLDVPIAE